MSNSSGFVRVVIGVNQKTYINAATILWLNFTK
jgi:hypothetical protein